jgi:two-component system phosphate regulon sensor histidine kinase PhoR
MADCAQEGRALSDTLGKAQLIDSEEPPPLELAGSASELLSAMSNLVSNAVRYTPAGGAIAMRWRTLPDGRGEFAVRDSGPGIAAEHLSRLTERFYRVDRSRSRETGGTGLGLAIVKHVTQRHNAELKIESTPGLGSTFAIVFPPSRLRPVGPPAATSGLPATESEAAR